MRFVACLGVKDEIELIGAAVNHLRRIGVELIIVIDAGSTDGTLDVLAEEEKRGDIWLHHVEDERDSLGPQRDIMLTRATGAEWALFPDNDEFYLPRGGSLHDLDELDSADILVVETYDTAISRGDGQAGPERWTPEAYDEILLYDHGPQVDRWPKIMARPEAIVDMIDGHHAATPAPGHEWREVIANDVLIAHLPFTTLARFQRKVANIRRYHERYPDWFDGLGSQWLEWLHADDEGRTPEVFESIVLDADEAASLKLSGSIRSAAELLAKRRHTRRAS